MIKKILNLILSILILLVIKNNSMFDYFLLTILFILILIIMNKSKLSNDKRKIIFITFLSLILSSFYIIGSNIHNYDFSYLNKISTYYDILIFSVLIYKILNILFELKLHSFNISISKHILYIINHKYNFWIFLLLILLSWIPILLAFYPGIFSYDASFQLNQYYSNDLNSSQPIIHTLFISIPINIGYYLFGSYNTGLLIHSIIQMLILSGSFAYSLKFLCERKAPNLLIIISLIIFMFLPIHSIFSITTTKDVVFSALYLLIVISFTDISLNPTNFFNSNKKIIILILLLVFMIIFRNAGIFILILCIPFILRILKKYYQKIILIIILSIDIFYIYNLFTTSMYNAYSGPIRESFNIPIQQLSRTYNLSSNLTNQEKRMIENIFDSSELKNYESHKSDRIKNTFKEDIYQNNKLEYLKLWINVGLKHPLIYIDAFLSTTYGYFYIGDVLPDNQTYRTLIEIRCRDDLKNTDIHFESKIPSLYNFYYDLIENGNYNKIPLVSLLFNIAFYIIIFIISFFYIWYNKKYNLLIPLIPLLILLLVSLCGPVSLLRYIYPIIICIPIILYLCYRANVGDYE